MQEESSGSQEESQHDVRAAAVVPAGPAPSPEFELGGRFLWLSPLPLLYGVGSPPNSSAGRAWPSDVKGGGE